MPFCEASDKASRYSCEPVRLMPLDLASSRTMPVSVSPDFVIRVAGGSGALACSSRLANGVPLEPTVAGVFSTDALEVAGVKLVF